MKIVVSVTIPEAIKYIVEVLHDSGELCIDRDRNKYVYVQGGHGAV